jgi:uncharacterized protein YuzE
MRDMNKNFEALLGKMTKERRKEIQTRVKSELDDMKKLALHYFQEEDVLHLTLSDEPEANSIEIDSYVTAELNDNGKLIGLEITEASSFLLDSLWDSIEAKLNNVDCQD